MAERFFHFVNNHNIKLHIKILFVTDISLNTAFLSLFPGLKISYYFDKICKSNSPNFVETQNMSYLIIFQPLKCFVPWKISGTTPIQAVVISYVRVEEDSHYFLCERTYIKENRGRSKKHIKGKRLRIFTVFPQRKMSPPP